MAELFEDLRFLLGSRGQSQAYLKVLSLKWPVRHEELFEECHTGFL
jgi:hypothetical protein